MFYATENQVSLCTLQMVKHFQEQDKIKAHKFTFDVHLAHYFFFPILKQCKQVTYAFKTPLPLPHPQGLFPPIIQGWSEGGGKICDSANVTVLKGCKQQRSIAALANGEGAGSAPFPSLHV